eukprot:TRINITY_DN7538_c0_g1_i2.p1 TRINITY_DN7538_c0_g1~~TRINITY_DN7538_c0_g1_i2.p1  ORF type:complete len:119 (-),score=29.96 TRINITY_DN7538_c0_g1_i2:33-389(-)
MELNPEEYLNITVKPKLEEKKSEIIKSGRTKRISHFHSQTNVHTFSSNEIGLQDSYDSEKEKLAELMEKVAKIQALYKSHRQRLQYKLQKEHQFSNRRTLVFRAVSYTHLTLPTNREV